MLQWGHSFSAVEMSANGVFKFQAVYASMGPQLFSRGDEAKKRGIDVRKLIASMGPQLFSRGDSVKNTYPAANMPKLQWGHSFSAVEICRMVPFNLDMLALQWGHSFSAVEIRQRSCCSACMCSASMGPQLFSRGDKSDCLKELHSTSRFNGATAFQPWRYIFGRHTPRLGIWLQWGHSFSAVEM